MVWLINDSKELRLFIERLILKVGCGMAKAYFNPVGPDYDVHAV